MRMNGSASCDNKNLSNILHRRAWSTQTPNTPQLKVFWMKIQIATQTFALAKFLLRPAQLPLTNCAPLATSHPPTHVFITNSLCANDSHKSNTMTQNIPRHPWTDVNPSRLSGEGGSVEVLSGRSCGGARGSSAAWLVVKWGCTAAGNRCCEHRQVESGGRSAARPGPG